MARYCLSITIVSMVARPQHAHIPTHDPAHVPAHALESSGNGACPVPGNGSEKATWNETMSNGEFEWDERAQGVILGAYYYGNVITNILGGVMAERIGSKPVILTGVFLSSILSLLSPVAASISTNCFIGVRLCLGFAQGVVMPAVSRCLAVWVPPYKRSKYNTIVFIGGEIGVGLSLCLGGWLCSQTFLGGWPAVYYVIGGVGMVWCVVWAVLVVDRPEQHPRISDEERKYLMMTCVVRRKKTPLPLSLLVRCVPFWALTVMHIGFNWGYYTFVSELPVYLANMQHFTIKNNGMISALPYLMKCTFALLFSFIMDRATAKGRLSILSVRRISMFVASYIPAAALVGMCFVGCDSLAAVVVMSAAVGVTGAGFCGLFCSHQDISPHFSGTIYGITNSIANVTGFVAPAVVGLITYENQTVRGWNTVFLISSLIYLVSSTIYMTCISDQVQAFDTPKMVDGRKEEEEEDDRMLKKEDEMIVKKEKEEVENGMKEEKEEEEVMMVKKEKEEKEENGLIVKKEGGGREKDDDDGE